MKKDFLSITDFDANEIWQALEMAKKFKDDLKNGGKNKSILDGKQMVMLFEKPSLRTKLSFDLAFDQLSGHSVYFGANEVGLGKREAIADVARVIASMADVIVARVCSHTDLQNLAEYSKVPVINALSDVEHPCQILADLFTIWEIKGKLKGLTIAYIGDGENNVAHSLVLGCALLGINFHCASPKGYWMKQEIVQKAKEFANGTGVQIVETELPEVAIKNADVVYTDTWVSMGDEEEQDKRLKTFENFQVNKELMNLSNKDAIFMHCLPAHRGEEVSGEVIDGPQSLVFNQAENRLHAEKALLLCLLDKY